MVEVLEYSIVFLASSLMVGFSVATASSFQATSFGIEDNAALSGLTAAAWGAVEHGNSSVVLGVVNSTVSCSGGVLSLSSKFYTGDARVPFGCGFAYPGLDGRHSFMFSAEHGVLELEVR